MTDVVLARFQQLIREHRESLPFGEEHVFQRQCLQEADRLVGEVISLRRNADAPRAIIFEKLAQAVLLAGEGGTYG